MTRLRAAVRQSFHASPVGRVLRRGIRTVSTRLYQAFGATPQGPVRLGLLCCLVAFVTVGAVSSSHFFRTREASLSSQRGYTPEFGKTEWSATTGATREAMPPSTPISSVTLPRTIRAVWVARFHYHDAADIAEIMRNCRAIGANTVLFQVRGEATVAYPSKIEPWSREYDFADPGFDPLAIAITEARKNDLRIEAWCNVMPGWMRKKPPPMKNHVYYTHPEWFIRDARGNRQPLNEDYVILNPCLPEVRAYIVSVFEEIVSRYAVDGLHLDYVRFAWDTEKTARAKYNRDAQTLELYREQTGKRPDDDPRAWDHWRANQLTRLVSDTRDMLARRRPGATLTAAVRGKLNEGYNDYLQNAVAWLRTGLIDVAYPMAYTENLSDFERMVGDYRTLAPESRIVPGVGIYKHDTADEMGRQLDYCLRTGGDFALFSYESLFPVYTERSKDKPDSKIEKLRTLRREVLSRAASAKHR